MIIREETAGDIEQIHTITTLAFAPMPFSNGSEPGIIQALRDQGMLTLSLVAKEGETVIGQATFSPVTVDRQDIGFFGLGPVAVLPEKQGLSIGSQLINAGLDRMRRDGAAGCALIGNPAYYSRFGFVNKTALTYGETDSAFVQQLVFTGALRSGALRFCPAFY